MDFLQSLRMGMLEQKFEYWNNSSNIDQFYSNLPHLPLMSIGTELTDDGYIHFSNNVLTYKNTTTGNTIILRKTWKETDYACHQALCSSTNNVRISQISYREIVNLSGIQYEYVEFNSPAGSLGINLFNWLRSETQEDWDATMKSFIDDGAILLKNAKNIAASNNTGVPERLVSSLQRFKDDNGFYWNIGLDWNNDPNIISSDTTQFVENFVNASSRDSAEKNQIINYMRTSWEI